MTWERKEEECEHDWLPPHQLYPLRIWHQMCCKCGKEIVLTPRGKRDK